LITPLEVIVVAPPSSFTSIDVVMAAVLSRSEFVRADATASDGVVLSRTAKKAARPVPTVMMPSNAKGMDRRLSREVRGEKFVDAGAGAVTGTA
jgi:hypothetical protein